MAQIASAGTLIAAVMETAGYITQEQILDTFQQFFQAAGVFIFVACALAALTATAVFGAYRAAIYLVVGPSLFYLMIFERTASNGVIWRLSDNQARGAGAPIMTEAAASAEARSLAENSQTPEATIRVSLFFDRFTHIIDGLVHYIASVIVPPEEVNKSLLFVNKNYAFDTLLDLKMQNPELVAIFEKEFLIDCNDMMDASLALASPKLTDQTLANLTDDAGNISDVDVQRTYNNAILDLNKDRAAYTQKQAMGAQKRFQPGPYMQRFMSEELLSTDPSATKDWATANYPGVPFAQVPVNSSQMSCGDGWLVVRDKIRLEAASLYKHIEDTYAQDLQPADRGLLCVTLARALGFPLADSEEARCQDTYIVELAATLLLRSAIANMGHSTAIRELQNRMELIETHKAGAVLGADGLDDSLYDLDGGEYNYQYKVQPTPDGDLTVAKYHLKSDGTEVWRPVRILQSDVMGHMDSVFVEHQRYQTRELRQKVFTVAIQFPYYQGVLLCLLAGAFPFAALLLVIPSKAPVFLNYLLAWMWVKSWDIGFAALTVIDKTIWSLFPTADFSADFYGGVKNGTPQALPVILQQAFKIDPSFNTHAYYFFLSAAAFAIPTICGYFTLKLRKTSVQAISTLITQPLISASESAAQYAGQAYGMTMLDLRQTAMAEMNGAALLTSTSQGGGYLSGGRSLSADYWAGQISKAEGDVARNVTGLSQFQTGDLAAAQARGDHVEKISYARNRTEMAIVESTVEGKRAQMLHPTLGRFGELQLMSDAYGAAMDGSGTYEINRNDWPGFLNQKMDMVSTKLKTAARVAGLQEAAQIGKNIGWSGSFFDVYSDVIVKDYRIAADDAAFNWNTYRKNGINPLELQMAYLVAPDDKKDQIRETLRDKLKVDDAEVQKLLNPTFGTDLPPQSEFIKNWDQYREGVSQQFSAAEQKSIFGYDLAGVGTNEITSVAQPPRNLITDQLEQLEQLREDTPPLPGDNREKKKK